MAGFGCPPRPGVLLGAPQGPSKAPQGQNLALLLVAQDIAHSGAKTCRPCSRQCPGRSPVVAGFQVSIGGRFLVSTEASPTSLGARSGGRERSCRWGQAPPPNPNCRSLSGSLLVKESKGPALPAFPNPSCRSLSESPLGKESKGTARPEWSSQGVIPPWRMFVRDVAVRVPRLQSASDARLSGHSPILPP